MGAMITALNLSYAQSIQIEPNKKKAQRQFEQAAGPDVATTGPFAREALVRGQGYKSLGEYELPLLPHPTSGHSDFPDIFIHGLVIKAPGTITHNVPGEITHLSPLIEIIANHELTCDPDGITNKLGFITVRSLELKADEKQIAQGDWHAHKPPSRESIIKRMLALDIPQSSLEWATKIDPHAIQSEYMVSDLVGTLLQAAPAPQPLDIIENDLSYNVREPRFSHRQAGDYEIVHGNSYTFHAAATPKPENIGQRRTFVLVNYAPTL